MPHVLIRNVPKRTLDALKKKAAQHGRSLQQELRLAVERVAAEHDFDYAEYARRMRERIASYAPHQSDSTELIRQDRRR